VCVRPLKVDKHPCAACARVCTCTFPPLSRRVVCFILNRGAARLPSVVAAMDSPVVFNLVHGTAIIRRALATELADELGAGAGREVKEGRNRVVPHAVDPGYDGIAASTSSRVRLSARAVLFWVRPFFEWGRLGSRGAPSTLAPWHRACARRRGSRRRSAIVGLPPVGDRRSARIRASVTPPREVRLCQPCALRRIVQNVLAPPWRPANRARGAAAT